MSGSFLHQQSRSIRSGLASILQACARFALFAPALIATVALQGCGESGKASPSLFPLNSGWVWRYEMVTTTDKGTTTEMFTVENTGKKNFGPGLEGWERRNSHGNFYLFQLDETGVYRIGLRNEIEMEYRKDPTDTKRFVLKEPINKIENSWMIPSVPYLMRKSFDWPYELKFTKNVTMNFRIEALNQTIKVQAGEFTDCTLVSASNILRIFVDATLGFQDLPITQKEWYCPGTGLVKLVRNEPVMRSTYYFGGSQSFELVELTK
jgi:hypothetical protein